MSYQKSSEELKKKPIKRKTTVKYTRRDKTAVGDTDSSKTNEIYSHSKDKSFDLSSIGNKAKNKKSKRNLIITNILLSILLVFSTFAFTATTILQSQLLKNKDVDQVEKGDFEALMVSPNKNVSYFLICGVDLSENLTDIIMVVCYDTANNEATVLQIPRDTYVGDVPSGKINAVYGNPREGESKIKALIRCINSKLGIPIDYYATITISGTEKVIDIMGGVEIILDRTYTLVDDSRNPEVKKTFEKGKVHLDGQWATALLRHRKSFSQGDLGRLKNQRAVYAAILKQITNISFSEVTSIVTNCMDDVSTNMSLGRALGYAKIVNKLNLENVEIMSLPGQTATINGLSCWVCHKQETVNMLNEYFRPYEETLLTTSDLNILDYSEVSGSYYTGYDEFLEGGGLDDFDRDPTTAATTNVQ